MIFYIEKFISKNCENIFSTRNLKFWVKILLYTAVGYLSVMFMQMFFSKVDPACHNIANDIKPGNN